MCHDNSVAVVNRKRLTIKSYIGKDVECRSSPFFVVVFVAALINSVIVMLNDVIVAGTPTVFPFHAVHRFSIDAATNHLTELQ